MSVEDELRKMIRAEVERALSDLQPIPAAEEKAAQPDPMTVDEAAAFSRRHPVTVRQALNKRQLHGSQRVPGARWLIQMECLEAWMSGENCPHYKPTINLIRHRTKQKARN